MASTMEVLQEEAIGMSHDHSHHIVKGRRTKRQRLLQPAVISSSSAGADDQNNTSSDENNVDSSNIMNSNYLPSPATSTGSTTEEEEDMANCLILLAQGRGGREDVSGRRLVEGPAAMTTTAGKTGLYVYECKTCNRCFPSFQALGGHRASHKKPKTMAVNGVEEESESNCLSLQLCKPIVPESGSKVRVHECSICGSEFSSGQALGGHMRRHRAAMAESSSQEISKKQKSLLLLDLNLPAPPEDDHRDFPKSPTRFSFAGKVQPLVFTASPLVDCHY